MVISCEQARAVIDAERRSTAKVRVAHNLRYTPAHKQFKHLDSLLPIEKLRLIQWIPSTPVSQPDYRNPLNWIPLFQRIQAAGKSALIHCPPEHVRECCGRLTAT